MVISLSFGIKSYDLIVENSGNHGISEGIFKVKLYYIFPDPFGNIAIQILKYMEETLLPDGVRLIQTAPGQAFFASIYTAVLVGIIGSIPIILREIYAFISPAIRKNTKNFGFINIFLPITGLFISGIVFSYLLIIPFTLNFLYEYGQIIGVATFLNVNEFISFTLQFFLAFGIAFQLPVLMMIFSYAGLVESSFWKKNFRYALLLFIIFGAIITPDGSGITMWFIVIPMSILYVLGILVVKSKENKRHIINT